MFADDSIIYASGRTIAEVRNKLQKCIDSLAYWYKCNRLKINESKSKVMVIGTRSQMKSLNVDEFIIKYDSSPLELVSNAKYLGLYVNADLAWDMHIMQLCKQMRFYVSMLRRLRKVFNKEIMLKIYRAYIQPKFDYGISLWGCTTESNLNKIQRIQNQAARLITGNFDYVNTRGIDLVKNLKLYNVRERRDYFITSLIFKAIHGIAPSYLSDNITMNFDIIGYNTRSTNTMNVYIPRPNKEMYRNSLLYRGGMLWNSLPDYVKDSPSLDSFKRNYHKFMLQR